MKVKVPLLAMAVVLVFSLMPLPASAAETEPPMWHPTEAKYDAESAYSQLVVELIAALVDFTTSDLTNYLEEGAPVPEELGAERDQFKATLLEIQRLPPPPQFYYFYCNILPFYEQILEAMDIIVDGAAENDKAKALTGKIWLSEISDEISLRLSGEQGEMPVPSVPPDCTPPPGVPMPDIPQLTIPFYSQADYERGELEKMPEEPWYEPQLAGDVETVKLVLEDEEWYWVNRVRLDAWWLYSLREEVERLMTLYHTTGGAPWVEGSLQSVVSQLQNRINLLIQSILAAKAAGCHVPANWEEPTDEARQLVVKAQELPTIEGISRAKDKSWEDWWEEQTDDEKMAYAQDMLKEIRKAIEVKKKRLAVHTKILALYQEESQRLAQSYRDLARGVEEDRREFIINALGIVLGAGIKYAWNYAPGSLKELNELKEDYEELKKIIEEVESGKTEALLLRAVKLLGKIYGSSASFEIAMGIIDKYHQLALLIANFVVNTHEKTITKESLDSQSKGKPDFLKSRIQETDENKEDIETLEADESRWELFIEESKNKMGIGATQDTGITSSESGMTETGRDDSAREVSGAGRLANERFPAVSKAANELGGIDFSSASLNYIALDVDPQSGEQQFKYMLKLTEAEEAARAIDLERSLDLSLSAFLIGLSLPNPKLWVNLSPDEADRVVDEGLGLTDVGRIMLEADLQMKKDFCKEENPCEKELGKMLWDLKRDKADQLIRECMAKYPGEINAVEDVILGTHLVSRHWIVPAEITAYGNGDEIYITEARLDIQYEPIPELSEFEMKNQNKYSLSEGCLECLKQANNELNKYAQEIEAQQVLPIIIKKVNNDEKYAQLRQVYVSLALAQWYKEKYYREYARDLTFSDLVDTGNTAGLESEAAWLPEDIWQRYVESYQNGEYRCEMTDTYHQDGYTVTRTRLNQQGGVSFENIGGHISVIGDIDASITELAGSFTNVPFLSKGGEYYLGGSVEIPPQESSEDLEPEGKTMNQGGRLNQINGGPPSELPYWLWIIVAVGIGAFAVFMIMMLSRRHKPIANLEAGQTPPALNASTASARARHTEKISRVPDSGVDKGNLPYCSECGAKLKPAAGFCHKCGAPAKRDSTGPTLGDANNRSQANESK